MATFKVEGIITKVSPVKTFKNDYRVQEFFLDTGEQYNGKFLFKAHGRKFDEMHPKLHEGDKVRVNFSVDLREWEGKTFINLSAFSITTLETKRTTDDIISNPDEDDLPF